MSNRSPMLCFGIMTNGLRSPYWRVRAGVANPELFLEREGSGRRWHLSLHASGRWHLKVDRQQREHWDRPPEIVPGFTRALGVVQPVAIARHDVPAPEGVELVPVVPDADPTAFNVFIERPGTDESSWPGKDATGTVLVGRIPLARQAGTCCIVAHQEPLAPRQVTVPAASPEELAHMERSAAAGTLVATVVGTLSDGGIALIDLLADRNLFSTAGLDDGE